eukprot:9828588-Lingulodinium_polyedra.AAC.1
MPRIVSETWASVSERSDATATRANWARLARFGAVAHVPGDKLLFPAGTMARAQPLAENPLQQKR